MLSAVAVRLATGKGLHKAPCKGWNLSSREISDCDRTFGVLYWLDKTIALRSGRPQVSSLAVPIPYAKEAFKNMARRLIIDCS
jgi:hypothetical protein